MYNIDLRDRIKKFAVRALKVADALPDRPAGWMICNQLARAAGSTAANYRAAQRARSRAEFASKLSITLEEADESAFWIEFAVDNALIAHRKVELLLREADELCAILLYRTSYRPEIHPRETARTTPAPRAPPVKATDSIKWLGRSLGSCR